MRDLFGPDDSTAHFSPCRTWRYSLERRWSDKHPIVFIGLNPSTADEQNNDPTIRRIIGFAKKWGHGRLVMLNLFAFRATQPDNMRRAADPVGPENNAMLQLETRGRRVVCAWGAGGEWKSRWIEVAKILKAGSPLSVEAMPLTKRGQPGHPLYMNRETMPSPWIPGRP